MNEERKSSQNGDEEEEEDVVDMDDVINDIEKNNEQDAIE